MKKKWKFGLKVADSHSEPGNLQKLEKIFIFFHFPCPWHLKSRKAMKNNGKPSKTKENEKKWSRKWKKNENLDSKLQILTPNQEIFKNEEIFIFFSFFYHYFIIFFSFSLPVAPEIQESHEKQWKTMENHQKTKENEKKMKLQMEKKWKLGLKVADSHSEPGNLQKLEKIFIFLSFSLPVAPEIQENHEKQWKTMENHQKQRKMKKKWSCKWKKNENLDSKLQILTPNQEIFKNSRKSFFLFFFSFFSFFFSFFFIFLARGTWNPGKPWKTMKNHQKQRKMKKNEVANEKKMKLQMKKNEVANEKKMKFDGKRWWTKMKKNEDKMKKTIMKMIMKMKMEMKKNEKIIIFDGLRL